VDAVVGGDDEGQLGERHVAQLHGDGSELVAGLVLRAACAQRGQGRGSESQQQNGAPHQDTDGQEMGHGQIPDSMTGPGRTGSGPVALCASAVLAQAGRSIGMTENRTAVPACKQALNPARPSARKTSTAAWTDAG